MTDDDPRNIYTGMDCDTGRERGVYSLTMPTDPMERLIATALTRAGIAFTTDYGGGNPVGLDFHLTDADVHIEVKQYHSDRIAEQMSRAPNVIAVQGRVAVAWLAGIIDAAATPRPGAPCA